MPNQSEFLSTAREVANAAFDEHCKQWDLLMKVANPTPEDLANWLSARDALARAQEKFESIVRQVSPAK